ncbi:MAG: tetratricopeptide repeat protein, partial [Cyanobacteria bacterium NC_groundwater_1444_Ag_S-0.65um_54_12]|nr:tetratricopeptide repeat protein [Cyanobacteria bacterium NC_groundwater_1444_Ag_S-0.65um_54_12]
LAWALLKQGDKSAAALAFRKAASNLLDRQLQRDAYYRLALLLLDTGKYQEAQAALQQVQALAAGAADQEVSFYLAQSQLRSGELEAAARGFGAIADQAADSLRGRQARYYQGQALWQMGRFREAGTIFEGLALQAAAVGEERVTARLRAAAAYFSADLFERSAELYALVSADASASEATRREVLSPLAKAYLQANRLSEAEGILIGAASGNPWVTPMLLQVAKGYAKQGKWREAAAVYGEIPNADQSTRWERARATRQSGETLAATELYEALVASANSNRPQILLELADTYGELEQLAKERSTLERLGIEPMATVKLSEATSQAWQRSGERAFKKEQFTEATLAFRTAERYAAQATPAAWKARYWLGSALLASHRFEDALLELGRLTASRTVPTKADLEIFNNWRSLALLKQGEALERLRHWEAARAAYREMVKDPLVPERDRQEALARLAWIKQNVPN